MADNIQDPNERQPDPDRTEGTTGREEDMPSPDRTVPGEERERDRLNRPDERRDEGELEADAEPGT
jgi:hypothetical protein